MTNRYQILYPVPAFASVAAKIVYDDGELRIQTRDRTDAATAEISFPEVLLFRAMDEGVRLRLLQELGDVRALVLVDHESTLLRWLEEEGLGTRDLIEARHYIAFVGEEIIDVVAFSAPEVAPVV